MEKGRSKNKNPSMPMANPRIASIAMASVSNSSPRSPMGRLYSSRMESMNEGNTVGVNVSTLDDEESRQQYQSNASSEKRLKHSRTLLISGNGQCIPLVEREKAKENSLSFIQSIERRESEFKITNPATKLFKKTRRASKAIDADEDVRSNYHDSYLYGKVAPSIKVRAAIRAGKWSHWLMWIESFAALVLVAFYVRSTHAPELKGAWSIVRVACALFFVVDYVVKLYSAPVRLYYIASYIGIIDFISILPFCFIWSPLKEDEVFTQVFLVLRFLRIIPHLAAKLPALNSIGRKIFELTVNTFGMVFIMAAILQWVELRATSEEYRRENNCSPHGCLNIYDTLYFVIVTISTVGYGDVTMHSKWGRAIALLTIIIALLVLPIQINKILELASRRPYGGRFRAMKVADSRFIIISGNLSYRTVQDFLSEFYHPCHGKDMSTFPLRVVIIAPYKPSFEMKILIANYQGQAEFYEGTPLNESDLNRVSAKMASAVFLMADRKAVNPDAEDAAQFVRSLCVHRYCGDRVRVIAEILKPENQNSAILGDIADGIEIVCPEAVRFHLLARSCHIAGLSTFLTNLFKGGLHFSTSGLQPCMQEYNDGLRQKVFPAILPSCFHDEGLLFEEAADIIYRKYHIILFGLDAFDENTTSREILLYPRGRQIMPSDVGLVIAKDIWAAEEISKFGKDDRLRHQMRSLACVGSLYGTTNDVQDYELIEDVKKHRLHTIARPVVETPKFTDPFTINFTVEGSYAKDTESIMIYHQRQEHNHKIQTIISSSQAPNVIENGCSMDQRFVSLEEAMDIAMSWPPANKWHKPEPPVLERRTDIILDNLSKRTLSVITWDTPHVLLCIQGLWPVNLFYFIRYLRMAGIPSPPIVILHPQEPDSSEWGCVGMFDEVYFIKGSPLYELDLVRSGVLYAERIIILAQRCRGTESNDEPLQSDVTTASFDINNILIAATVERLIYPARDRIVVELQEETLIHHLSPKFHINTKRFHKKLYARNRESDYMFTPPYMEGKGFSPATLNFLLYSTFFNCNTVDIIDKLLSGGDYVMGDGSEQAFIKKLEQIPVPKAYIGKTIAELYLDALREENILVLGLHRPRGTHNSEVSYVYTNPNPEEKIVAGDLLYMIRS